MGQAARASYKTITGGIEGMFTKNGTTTVEAEAKSLKDEVVKKAGAEVTTKDITKQAVDAGKTKVLEDGTITASGKVVGDDAIAKSIEKSLANLPEAGSPGDMFKWDSATQKYIPKTEQELMTGKLELAMQEEPAKYIAQKKGAFGLRTDDITTRALKDPVTGEAIIPKGFREVDSLRKPSLLDKVYEMPFAELNKEYGLGAKPLKSFERLPGILREGTVGEAKAVYDFTRPIPDPYIPGSSDMTGAISALSENDARLFGQMSMDQLINQPSVPSPSVIGTADYMNNTRKVGFVWDTALLATQPSSLPSVPRTPGISF
jgi:hypothetical protein